MFSAGQRAATHLYFLQLLVLFFKKITVVRFQEPAAEAAASNHEDLKKGSSNSGTAEDAEAEAIRSGLQVIHVLSYSMYCCGVLMMM